MIYRLGDRVAMRRASASAMLRAAATLAPLAFAVVLLGKLGWQPPSITWIVVAALVALVVARATVDYAATRRRLRSLVITASEDALRVEAPLLRQVMPGARVASITEIDGPLGGLRIVGAPDPSGSTPPAIHVPRGGEAFGDLRAAVERWRPIRRRGRRSPATRWMLGAVVVAGIFFVPFLLDDFVARSRFVAGGLVLALWGAMRFVLKRG